MGEGGFEDVTSDIGKKKCNLCDNDAVIDGPTTMGPWGYMCADCHASYGAVHPIGKNSKLDPNMTHEELDLLSAKAHRRAGFSSSKKARAARGKPNLNNIFW